MSTKAINRYRIQAPDTASYSFPKDFTLQRSSDNSAWTTIDTHTGMADPTRNLWTSYVSFTNTTPYRYWRINVTDESDVSKTLSIKALELIESGLYTEDMGA